MIDDFGLRSRRNPPFDLHKKIKTLPLNVQPLLTLFAPAENNQQRGKGEREGEYWEVNLAECSEESLLGKHSAHNIHKTDKH